MESIPKPSEGMDYSKEEYIVVPDQSLSLEEILQRFTRGEPLDILMDGEYDDESDIDLEKLQKADLVDKNDYIEYLKNVQKRFLEQKEPEPVKEPVKPPEKVPVSI